MSREWDVLLHKALEVYIQEKYRDDTPQDVCFSKEHLEKMRRLFDTVIEENFVEKEK